jgi:lysophospholipase L1-like esterase
MRRTTTIALLLAALLAAPSAPMATVTGTTTRNSYTGDASTVAFAFTFRADSSSWVKVYLDNALQGAGYTVALNANQTANPGGTVTFTSPPASSVAVKIQRESPKTQASAFSPYTAFPSKTVEGTLDKLAMQGQELDRGQADLAAVVGTGNPDANLAQVTAAGSTTARTLKDWTADVISNRDVNFRQRARDLDRELAALRAQITAMEDQSSVDSPDVVLRIRGGLANTESWGGSGAFNACEQSPRDSISSALATFTRVGNAINNQVDHDFTADGGQYTCLDNLLPQTPRGYWFERAATQYLLNNCTTPVATQTTGSLGTGWYSAWSDGSANVTFSAGTATATGLPCTTNVGNFCSFKVTGAGTVTATVPSTGAGKVYLQSGPYRSSPICAAGTTYTRNAESMNIANALTNADANWTVCSTVEPYQRPWTSLDTRDALTHGVWYIGPGAGSNSARLDFDVNTLRFLVWDNASASKLATVTLNSGLVPGPHVICAVNANGTFSVYVDGRKQTAVISGAGTGTITTQPATMDIGRLTAGNEWDGFIYDLAVCKVADPARCRVRVPPPRRYERTFVSAGNTVGLIGDSITAGNDKTQSDRGYWNWANVLTDHRFRVVAFAGVGGDRSADALARVTAQVVARQPALAVVFIGVNDLPAGVAYGTVLANIQAITQILLDNGITPVVSTVPPSNSFSAGNCTDWFTLNAAITSWARSAAGVVYADMGHANSQAGANACYPLAGTVTDAVHPSALGAYNMGNVLAAAMRSLAPKLDSEWTQVADDPSNILSFHSDPFMVQTGGTATAGGGTITGVVPLGWELKAFGGTLTTSQVARTDNRPGKWFQIAATVAPSSNDTELVAVADTGVQAGWMYYGQCEFQADAGWTAVKRLELNLEARASAGTVYANTQDLKQVSSSDSHPSPSGSFILRTAPFVAPTYWPTPNPTAKLALRFLWNVATGTIRVGRCEIRRADRVSAP